MKSKCRYIAYTNSLPVANDRACTSSGHAQPAMFDKSAVYCKQSGWSAEMCYCADEKAFRVQN